MNDKYHDDERDWEDNYYPIFDFRPSKWMYDRTIIRRQKIKMNKTQLTRLKGIKQRLRINLTNMKDLIRWCEDYKTGKCETVGQIMSAFTLKWDDVSFIIANLKEIKKLER